MALKRDANGKPMNGVNGAQIIVTPAQAEAQQYREGCEMAKFAVVHQNAALRAKRSPAEQMRLLASRPGESRKEMARLRALMA